MKASQIINEYIKFFEEKGHTRIPNYSLVPENDPTTLFTSSGMQPLVPYLLGEEHPQGKKLVDVQNCFRAVDIEEVGNNRHTTFFRMLGNWSLGEYFKSEQIPWLFEFLTKRLNINPGKLYVTVFEGFGKIEKDNESAAIWKKLFEEINLNPGEKIFYYGVEKNWWSRAGTPDKMPVGEPGGPDTEVFYDFGGELKIHEKSAFKNEKCHVNCDCGRYIEICNSVFMQYKKTEKGFEELPQKNVDFGGGLERFLMATENKQDVFETSLFSPIISEIAKITGKDYGLNSKRMRIIADHLISGIFIISNNIRPANKEQGYILRRLLRRSFDNFYELGGSDINPIIHKIVEQYKETDEVLVEKFEIIKNVILEEEEKYSNTRNQAKKLIGKELEKIGKKHGDELLGTVEIPADLAFKSLATLGLGPTQLKSLGYTFDEQALAEKIKEHQNLSRAGAQQKFAGGLADHQEMTIKGHTATHLMHQALRDVLGDKVHQTGSNITSERVRFDFNYDEKLTDEQIKKVEDIVRLKISDNLQVYFEMMPLQKAKDLGAIGLFDEKYEENVKIYFIGGEKGSDQGRKSPSTSEVAQDKVSFLSTGLDNSKNKNQGSPTSDSSGSSSGRLNEQAYSIEFCGGPHVDFTGRINSFKIIKEEGLGRGQRRIYAVVE